MFTRFEIITNDRIGITIEILQKVYEKRIDLISVEVFPKKVCIKTNEIKETTKNELISKIKDISDVIKVNETDLMEYEKAQRKLLAVIDSVDEGIMVVSNKGKVEIFNKYCEELFKYSKDEVIGNDINDVIKANPPMVDLLENGKNYDNVELKFKNDRGEIHYITTGRAIKNDLNKTIGGVATIKDIKKVIKLVNKVSSTKEGFFNEIVGSSKAIESVKNIVATVAKNDSIVLLRGESGTGKELFAKAIKNLSMRKNKRYVEVNCAALPEALIESELFGYEKGSFTGALTSGKEGLFKEADGGTIFLDEIGEVSLKLQAKLLRVLQEGTVRKIGSFKEDKINIRIIAATNKNLEKMVEEGTFREDLYYRLNVIPIYIPPLRDRKEDIPNLVNFFIDKLNIKLNKEIIGADFKFISKLLNYSWPGNVRELQNVIERAMNLCSDNMLTELDLILNFDNSSKITSKAKFNSDLKLNEAVEICEKERIFYALNRYKTIRKAAKALGVSHTTIINKIKKYNINWNE